MSAADELAAWPRCNDGTYLKIPRPHVCNCIGCCRRCGTCRSWPGHTREWCDLLVKQRGEREDLDRKRAEHPEGATT